MGVIKNQSKYFMKKSYLYSFLIIVINPAIASNYQENYCKLLSFDQPFENLFDDAAFAQAAAFRFDDSLTIFPPDNQIVVTKYLHQAVTSKAISKKEKSQRSIQKLQTCRKIRIIEPANRFANSLKPEELAVFNKIHPRLSGYDFSISKEYSDFDYPGNLVLPEYAHLKSSYKKITSMKLETLFTVLGKNPPVILNTQEACIIKRNHKKYITRKKNNEKKRTLKANTVSSVPIESHDQVSNSTEHAIPLKLLVGLRTADHALESYK